MPSVKEVIDEAPAVLADVRGLYGRTLMLQALAAASALGPIKDWRGAEARVLGGRLAMNVGAPRLGSAMHVRAHREHPDSAEAACYCGYTVAERFGPLSAWEFVRRVGSMDTADPLVRADWLALQAMIVCRFRDFDQAESLLARADGCAPDHAWLCVERANLLEAEDRYEEALAAARRALEIQPDFRPGVQKLGHLLQLLDRDEEALELLTGADERLESGAITWQLANLQQELRRYTDARASLDRFEKLSPLLEKPLAKVLAARKSDVAYHCGDVEEAVRWAKESGAEYLQKVAEKLRESQTSGDGRLKRIALDVPFVRQHHMTCAPATLAALSRFWSQPAEHLAVVEAICYDGTPAHSERQWAQSNGWIAREFTVTWESAVALIDRGVPFTLTTTEATSGHLQAVIGYDALRGTLIVRDPFQYYSGEFHYELMFKRYAATGPRGMTMVPAARAELLSGVELPDADLYDRLYELQTALNQHDRDGAAQAWLAMVDAAENHRLTLTARRSLCAYDADSAGGLECVTKLLEQFPDSPHLNYAKVMMLRALTRRDEHLAMLRQLSEAKGAEPVFWQLYANELRSDARRHREARSLLRKVVRRMSDPPSLFGMASILWAQRKFERATQLYHWLACLDDKNEIAAQTYFVASRHLRQTNDALAMLKARFERFGARSGQPARTLFWAYEALDRLPEGLAVLERALALRQEEGELALFAADARARHGDLSAAAELLQRAKEKCPRVSWLRTAAALDALRGDLAGALKRWKQVVEAQPLAVDAHQAVARLLAETQSPAAAVAHVQAVCQTFPHHYALHQLWVSWVREEDPDVAERVLRQLVETHPFDDWALQELAMLLRHRRQFDEALRCADQALGIEPNAPASHTTRGLVLASAGRIDEAREAYRQALRLAVDTSFAADQLIRCCDTARQRREELEFLRQELVRQVTFGDGLLAYRALASDSVESEDLLGNLMEALEARPDLWHAWSAVIRQLVDMDRAAEAEPLAEKATQRFPLQPRLWFDLATVHRATGNLKGELEALNQCRRISPTWPDAARALAEVHRRSGEWAEAKKVLTAAIAHSPLDAAAHEMLADTLWRLGEKKAALERGFKAVEMEPGLSWAWRAISSWAAELGQPTLAENAARQLTQRRPGEARSWLVLARILAGAQHLNERLAALDQALQLNPRLADACDLKAVILAQEGRLDEALAACRPPAFGDLVPVNLRGRAAWIRGCQGNVKKAIAEMQSVLNEEPSYYWGWCRLVEWLSSEKNVGELIRTAQEMTEQFPRDAGALCWLADARSRTGNRDGAIEALRRALRLEPDHSSAAKFLFDLELDARDIDGALATLESQKKLSDDDSMRAREAKLALVSGKTDLACRKLHELCVSTDADRDPLNEAIAAFDKALVGPTADKTLQSALADRACRPVVGEILMTRVAARNEWKTCELVLDLMGGRDELWAGAAVAYMNRLPQLKRRRQLARFIRRNNARLRGDTRAWGTAGYALHASQQYRAASKWMADWRERKDARPWMLFNLVEALHRVGRDREAYEVGQMAWRLPPDHTRQQHAIWLALEEVLAGQPGEASDIVVKLNPAKLTPAQRLLVRLTQAMLSLERAAPESRKQTLRDVRAAIAFAADSVPNLWKTQYHRPYRRCLRRLSKRAHHWPTTLWCWCRSRPLRLS